ncbi:hypothetical protein DLM78_17510 [Leptospira stimsonii]|uniref:Uncharacterized protein n=1 Tax=Leptospira stimsonii TaxID=2202203 RepID=A0A8B3CME1_9LEPT|nr:hypothetical protein DLM78_17510 [Leptospira stimsonii]
MSDRFFYDREIFAGIFPTTSPPPPKKLCASLPTGTMQGGARDFYKKSLSELRRSHSKTKRIDSSTKRNP